jgi:hypothetical protein
MYHPTIDRYHLFSRPYLKRKKKNKKKTKNKGREREETNEKSPHLVLLMDFFIIKDININSAVITTTTKRHSRTSPREYNKNRNRLSNWCRLSTHPLASCPCAPPAQTAPDRGAPGSCTKREREREMKKRKK